MHVIAKPIFIEAGKRFPNERAAIMDAYDKLRKGTFNTPDEMRGVFPSLDYIKGVNNGYVINLGGNNLRLMALIFFSGQKFFVRHIVTHAEYDELCKQLRKKGARL